MSDMMMFMNFIISSMYSDTIVGTITFHEKTSYTVFYLVLSPVCVSIPVMTRGAHRIPSSCQLSHYFH